LVDGRGYDSLLGRVVAWALGENRTARQQNPSFSCIPDSFPYMYLIPPKDSRIMGFTPFIP